MYMAGESPKVIAAVIVASFIQSVALAMIIVPGLFV